MNERYEQLPLFKITSSLEVWHGSVVYVIRAWFWNGYTQVLYFQYL